MVQGCVGGAERMRKKVVLLSVLYFIQSCWSLAIAGVALPYNVSFGDKKYLGKKV
jgi:hypothetical protein